jgi:hypothetical protein
MLDEIAEEPDAEADVDELADQLSTLATDDITLVSHDHGRDRRRERGISRRELQQAVK